MEFRSNFFLILFQLFVSFLGKAVEIFRLLLSIIISGKSFKRNQLISNISFDIWIDVGYFLNVEERQQLKLVNHQICMAIEKGMQKLWRSEEEAISVGDLLITKRRALLYRINLIKLLGRQNLFLRTRIRIVENVNPEGGKLGNGDAIIVGCEYKPFLDGEVMDKSEGLARIRNNLWTFARWICRKDSRKENYNFHNVLQQYEERLLINSGRLMWGRTQRMFMRGYTVVVKCRLKKELDQRWISCSKNMPKELCMNVDADKKVKCCNNYESSDAILKFEDCFSIEILRSLKHCWPRKNMHQSFPDEMGPIHLGWHWLKKFDKCLCIDLDKVDMEYFDKVTLDRPQCHLDIAENGNHIMHMSFPYPGWGIAKKPHIFENGLGLHFYDEQKLIGSKREDFVTRTYFHRLIKLPENYQKNSLEWEQTNRYPRYFTAIAFQQFPEFDGTNKNVWTFPNELFLLMTELMVNFGPFHKLEFEYFDREFGLLQKWEKGNGGDFSGSKFIKINLLPFSSRDHLNYFLSNIFWFC